MPTSPQREWQRLRMLVTPPPQYLPCKRTRLLQLPPDLLQRIRTTILCSHTPSCSVPHCHLTHRLLQDAIDAYQLSMLHPRFTEIHHPIAANTLDTYPGEGQPDPSISLCTPNSYALLHHLVLDSRQTIRKLVLHQSAPASVFNSLAHCPNLSSITFYDSHQHLVEILNTLPRLNQIHVFQPRVSTLSCISCLPKPLKHLSISRPSPAFVEANIGQFLETICKTLVTISLHIHRRLEDRNHLARICLLLFSAFHHKLSTLTLIFDTDSLIPNITDALLHGAGNPFLVESPTPYEIVLEYVFKRMRAEGRGHVIVKCPSYSFCLKSEHLPPQSCIRIFPGAMRLRDMLSPYAILKLPSHRPDIGIDQSLIIERACVQVYHSNRIKLRGCLQIFLNSPTICNVNRLSCCVDDDSTPNAPYRWNRVEADLTCTLVSDILHHPVAPLRQLHIDRELLVDAKLDAVRDVFHSPGGRQLSVLVLRVTGWDASLNVRFLNRLPSLLQCLYLCPQLRTVLLEDSGGIGAGYQATLACETAIEAVRKLERHLSTVDVSSIRGMLDQWLQMSQQTNFE